MAIHSMSCSSSCYHEGRESREIFRNIHLDREIVDDLEFSNKVIEAFKTIQQGEIGSDLIQKIGTSRHIIWIKKSENNEMYVQPYNEKGVKDPQIGSCVTLVLSDTKAGGFGKKGEKIKFPFFIILVHELIHGWHCIQGITKSFEYKDLGPSFNLHRRFWTSPEEEYTITGDLLMDRKSVVEISENAIRLEHGLPERGAHLYYIKEKADALCHLELVNYLRTFANSSINAIRLEHGLPERGAHPYYTKEASEAFCHLELVNYLRTFANRSI